MSNKPNITTPTVKAQIIVQGMSNGGLNITGTGSIDLDIDLLLAAMHGLQQRRKQKTKGPPLIQPANLGPVALDLVNGGKR